jgi:hypothetical protein
MGKLLDFLTHLIIKLALVGLMLLAVRMLLPVPQPSETAAIWEDLCVEMRGVPEFNWWGYFSGCRWPGRAEGNGR